MTETGKTPRLPAADLGRLGYKVVIYPATARLITFAEWTELTGLARGACARGTLRTDATPLPGFTTGPLEPQQRR